MAPRFTIHMAMMNTYHTTQAMIKIKQEHGNLKDLDMHLVSTVSIMFKVLMRLPTTDITIQEPVDNMDMIMPILIMELIMTTIKVTVLIIMAIMEGMTLVIMIQDTAIVDIMVKIMDTATMATMDLSIDMIMMALTTKIICIMLMI